MTLIFSTSRMEHTVALTKTIFFLKKISRTIGAKTPTALASVFFIVCRNYSSRCFENESKKITYLFSLQNLLMR